MCETIEQCCGHFGIAKDAGPFTEAQVGGDDDAGALIQLAQKRCLSNKLSADFMRRL